MSEEAMLTAGDLRKLYPKVFDRNAAVPLQIGIFDELMKVHGNRLAKQVLRALLGMHTATKAYLIALAKGGPRYGLDGLPHGEVTEEEQRDAFERLEKLKAAAHADQMAQKHRSDLLKSYEKSGMSRAEFAERFEIAPHKLNSDLDKAKHERMQRNESRLKIVQRLENSGLPVEEFAKKAKLPVGKVRTAVQKVAEMRASTASPQ